MSERDVYPFILRTEPPVVVTREQVDAYFHERRTIVRVIHIPATNPQDERIDHVQGR